MTEENFANSSQMEITESSDDGTSTDGPNPFTVPLILRQIFIHLPPLDLISCSEVNKLWNYEARTVLRDFKTCVAMNKGDRPCCSLRDLDADLSRMTIVPYTGLRLRIPNHPRSLCTKTKAEFNFLLHHLKLKVFKLDWEWTATTEDRCPAIQLMSSILRGKHGDTVEDVYYVRIPLDRSVPIFNRDNGFPQLRKIRFPPHLSSASFSPLFFSHLITSAPNLELLDVEFRGAELRAVEPKYGLVRNFRFHPLHWTEETRKFALSQPKLERLTAYAPDGLNNEHAPTSWDSLRLIFLSISKTLKYLKLESAVLAMFRLMKVQPMENLEALVIGISPGGYEDEDMLDEIYGINFTRLCPKINAVTVFEVTGGRRRIPLLPVLDPGQEEPGDSSRIWKLTAEECFASEALVKLSGVFPHVTSLTASATRSVIYFDLWKSWMNLRSASITQSVNDSEFNLDAAFCGIFPAEVGFLQEQDDEFLKNYHLVPVRPGLFALKWLKDLHISLRVDESIRSYDSVRQSGKFFLSNVTGHFVLSRMKHLAVTVECDLPQAVRHLCTFVKLIEDEDDDDDDPHRDADDDDDSDTELQA